MVNAPLKHKCYTPALAGFEAVRDNADVLIVSETDARSLEGVMLASGRTVKALTSSSAAGRYLLNNSPKLILIDADLKGINGTSVVDRLKRSPRFSATPMIVLVEAVSSLRSQAEFCKADKVLLKPFSSCALTQLIDRLLPANASSKPSLQAA